MPRKALVIWITATIVVLVAFLAAYDHPYPYGYSHAR